MDLDQDKNEKFLELVQKYQNYFDDMNYEFYDLDTPAFNGKIESTTFILEVLRMNHLLDNNTKIEDVKEYQLSLFKEGVVDGFTFMKDKIPYYIGFTEVSPPEGHEIIDFGHKTDPELQEEENKLIEIFELFRNGESLRKLYHYE